MSEEIDKLLEAVESYGDVMRQLRAAGIEPDPNASMVPLSAPEGTVTVVITDRVEDVPEPAYCVHGYSTCLSCGKVVLLGDQTFDAVADRRMYPLCLPCSRRRPPQDYVGTLHDTWRGMPHG